MLIVRDSSATGLPAILSSTQDGCWHEIPQHPQNRGVGGKETPRLQNSISAGHILTSHPRPSGKGSNSWSGGDPNEALLNPTTCRQEEAGMQASAGQGPSMN